MHFGMAIVMLSGLALAAPQRNGQADILFERAVQKETAEGDLKAALELYRQAVAKAGANRSVAAKALIRIGQCHEKLGEADARKAYERVVREFGDQKEATTARARLAVLGKAPSSSGAMSAQLLARQTGVRIGQGSRIALGQLTLPFFGADGNLHIRDLQSGDSRRLTDRNGSTSESYGWAAVPSRDGSRIAYSWVVSTSRNELRLASISNGNVRTVPLKIEPAGWANVWDWAPDGKHLLVWVASNSPTILWNIAIVNVDTAELRHLSSPRAGRCERGSFSADGRHIVAACRKDEKSDWDIFVIDPVSGKETAIVTGSGDDSGPLWISDSGQIAFLSDRQGKNGLWRVDYRDGVASAPSLLQSDIGEVVLLGAAKDGSIIYGRQNSSKDIYLANLDPQSLRLQGTPARFVESYLGQNGAPSWSPSGNAFAYSSRRDVKGRGRLVIHSLDEKEIVSPDLLTWLDSQAHWCSDSQLAVWGTPHAATLRAYDSRTGAVSQPDIKIDGLKAPYQLAYSPDCRSVYVSSYLSASRQRRVFRIDIDSMQQTDLLVDNAEWSLVPRVSPDGRWLAMHGRLTKDGNAGIIMIPAAGGAPRMLAPDAGDNSFAWTPDSKRLLFVRKVQGQQEIYSVSLDGAAPQTTGIRMPGLSSPSLHPDGKRLLFTAIDSTSEVWSLSNLPTK